MLYVIFHMLYVICYILSTVFDFRCRLAQGPRPKVEACERGPARRARPARSGRPTRTNGHRARARPIGKLCTQIRVFLGVCERETKGLAPTVGGLVPEPWGPLGPTRSEDRLSAVNHGPRPKVVQIRGRRPPFLGWNGGANASGATACHPRARPGLGFRTIEVIYGDVRRHFARHARPRACSDTEECVDSTAKRQREGTETGRCRR